MTLAERTNGDFFPLIVAVIIVLIFFDNLPQIQELRHWFTLVGIRVSVAKFDANYGFDL